MLTTATRLRIQDILRRVAQGQSVSLQDRIYVNKFAEHDRTVNSWVSRARRLQLQQAPSKGLDGFLADLDLGSEDEEISTAVILVTGSVTRRLGCGGTDQKTI